MLRDSIELRYDTFAHEFAHQLHYYGLTPAEQAVVRSLFRSARDGDRCLDYYAATHESEYLAQGYEAFVSVVKSPWRHVIRRHTRAELAERDPPLYRFLCRITGTMDPDPALEPLAPRILAFYEWAGDGPSLEAARSLLAPRLAAPALAEPR